MNGQFEKLTSSFPAEWWAICDCSRREHGDSMEDDTKPSIRIGNSDVTGSKICSNLTWKLVRSMSFDTIRTSFSQFRLFWHLAVCSHVVLFSLYQHPNIKLGNSEKTIGAAMYCLLRYIFSTHFQSCAHTLPRYL